MITKQRQLFYFVDGKPFKTIKEAQLHDLSKIAQTILPDGPSMNRDQFAPHVAEWLLKNAASIVDCLTTTPTSRAKARKTNGARRTRKRPVLAPATLPEP